MAPIHFLKHMHSQTGGPLSVVLLLKLEMQSKSILVNGKYMPISVQSIIKQTFYGISLNSHQTEILIYRYRHLQLHTFIPNYMPLLAKLHLSSTHGDMINAHKMLIKS
jgi:hypothetical protein